MFLKQLSYVMKQKHQKSQQFSFLQGTDNIAYNYAHAKIEMQWSYFLTHF